MGSLTVECKISGRRRTFNVNVDNVCDAIKGFLQMNPGLDRKKIKDVEVYSGGLRVFRRSCLDQRV